MQWVARIQQALEQDRFFLRAQPIAPVQARADAGDCYEILIGLEDHAGNWVEPGAFLPAAERFGLIAAIDRWVFCRTLAWLEADPQRLERLALCTINLSGTSVADEHMLAFIVEAFGSHQVSAHKICFEITETAAIANLSRAVQFMQALKRLGCRFALDDFGSGMSSFAYLKNLPVDFLKIDGNFVRDVATDPVDRAMVQAIHQVGHVMQIQTIAEHVESEQILAVLREIGVDYAQGYGIARPQRLP
jgi:EAL domain-containing protein (putative c-di-GMP-specific phosphodiesterase class I)